jgi:hypothetical protein
VEYFRHDVKPLFLWCYAASWWMVLAWIWDLCPTVRGPVHSGAVSQDKGHLPASTKTASSSNSDHNCEVIMLVIYDFNAVSWCLKPTMLA